MGWSGLEPGSLTLAVCLLDTVVAQVEDITTIRVVVID
jgi:hypothetical protein